MIYLESLAIGLSIESSASRMVSHLSYLPKKQMPKAIPKNILNLLLRVLSLKIINEVKIVLMTSSSIAETNIRDNETAALTETSKSNVSSLINSANMSLYYSFY